MRKTIDAKARLWQERKNIRYEYPSNFEPPIGHRDENGNIVRPSETLYDYSGTLDKQKYKSLREYSRRPNKKKHVSHGGKFTVEKYGRVKYLNKNFEEDGE